MILYTYKESDEMRNVIEELNRIDNRIAIKEANGINTDKENKEFRILMADIYEKAAEFLGTSSADQELRKRAVESVIEEHIKVDSSGVIELPGAAVDRMTSYLIEFFNELCNYYHDLKTCLLNDRFEKDIYEQLLFLQEVFDTFYQDYYFASMNYFGNDDDIPEHDYSSRNYSYEIERIDYMKFIHRMDGVMEKFQLNLNKYVLYLNDCSFNECKDILITVFFLNFDILHLLLSIS